MTGRHRDLDTYSHRLNRAANVVPDVMRHLDEQRSTVIVLSASSASIGSNGTHGDPALRAMLQLDRIEHRRRGVLDMIATLGRCIDLLDEACRDALGVRGEDPVLSDIPQCTRDADDLLPNGETQRCGRHVEHFYRADGTMAFREGGACAMHRRREARFGVS